MNQNRIAKNTRPGPHQATTGALREGAALLQGLAICGQCGRKLKVYYQGKQSTPGYYCPGSTLVNGRSQYCMRIGAMRIDRAVADVFLKTIQPAGVDAVVKAETIIEANHDAALEQWRLQCEQAQYEADKAERRYRAVEPENRLVARKLETEWEQRLSAYQTAQKELEERRQRTPRKITDTQRKQLCALGADLEQVWSATTTTDRDRKELLNTLIEEVGIAVDRKANQAHLTIRWNGGLISELDIVPRAAKTPPLRTDEGTIELLRRLAPHYSNAVIAGILNRQGRQTATGLRFTAVIVSSLRQHWKLPRWERPQHATQGEVLTIKDAAKVIGVAPSTLHRHLNDGIIVGEQLTPGAPWRIRITEELLKTFAEEAPVDYIPIVDAMRILGVSRQTVLQRVKQGKLLAIHVRRGRRKGLRIKVLNNQLPLFNGTSSKGV